MFSSLCPGEDWPANAPEELDLEHMELFSLVMDAAPRTPDMLTSDALQQTYIVGLSLQYIPTDH